MNLWQRLWVLMGKVVGRRSPPPLLPAPTEEPVYTPPPPEDDQEQWFDELMSACVEGQKLEDVGGVEFLANVGRLVKRGDDLLAAQWLEKFVTLPLSIANQHTLRARIVDVYDERGDLEPALGHLAHLSEDPEHAAKAHYRLAEHHRRRGNEAQALRSYEEVLAIEVDYPNVRERYQRLRASRGQGAAVSTAETMAGASGAGDGSRYLLVRELGRGAAGVVYLARDMELERDVAVKLLHPHLAAAHRQRALDVFFDEARVAASLRHPNIVAILDIDERARRIVMELCDGGTLRSVLRDRGPRPVERALERHAQLLSAVDAAHARGVVHRDIKPANLMFRRDPDLPGTEVVLADFGIAHLPDAEGMTGSARALENKAAGTLAYMAPEQRLGEVVPRSDLYAAAVVLFEMLTGRFPWSREALMAGIRHRDDFELPPELGADLPDLRSHMQEHLKALGDPDPSSRPTTVEAMKVARRLRDLAMVEGRP